MANRLIFPHVGLALGSIQHLLPHNVPCYLGRGFRFLEMTSSSQGNTCAPQNPNAEEVF